MLRRKVLWPLLFPMSSFKLPGAFFYRTGAALLLPSQCRRGIVYHLVQAQLQPLNKSRRFNPYAVIGEKRGGGPLVW